MLTNYLAACAYLTITVSEIQRDIGRKSSIFCIPLAFDAPVRGVPVGIAPPRFVWKKLEWLSYHVEDIFIRFGLTHERDGQTDRHRGWQQRPRLCIASRGKNWDVIISPLSPEAPAARIFTKIDLGAYLPDVIICSQFHINQWRGFDSVRGRISPFPIGKRDRR